ncbi:unnamed protein product [Lactuca virosa]|uniref:Uncharacterized protein n=1 Tax=Lactuca virosa TaxID=75947 RepID=A0AAU9LPL0_9ASTR|nr:unnamed protein product [Lactuca virosa]
MVIDLTSKKAASVIFTKSSCFMCIASRHETNLTTVVVSTTTTVRQPSRTRPPTSSCLIFFVTGSGTPPSTFSDIVYQKPSVVFVATRVFTDPPPPTLEAIAENPSSDEIGWCFHIVALLSISLRSDNPSLPLSQTRKPCKPTSMMRRRSENHVNLHL